ncbi:laminin subunit alpha-3 [Myxocyprinus asiaticus]|uniref:laminin subunit alpha-3 n=1 Tax=Myxocyprinus asiaticus TaxID=70543 RepID=UPI002221FCD0|nr:laminin subunit alpha-3 [Myxocyprinus asiaticus]
MSESSSWRSVALGALLFGALLLMVSGGPRPQHRAPRHPQRLKAQWTPSIQYPALNDAQRIQFPSVHDSQTVQYPALHDVQNCQFNTAGHHCERCKDGYYGNAAQRTCRPCPCPLSTQDNNFAVGCTEMNGRFQCLCKVGYTGEACERCAVGFYGDPQVSGGRCHQCNCPGNLCDITTGVCRNSQELQRTNPEEECAECDNCAQVLLNDLEKLDVELKRIKDQLDLDSLTPSSKEHLKKLEEAMTATMNLVTTFSSTVNKQRPKIDQLEQDVLNLADDMDSLKEQVRKRSDDSQKAIATAENSHQRAKDLDAETQNLLKKIQELLKQLVDGNSGGAALPSADLAKLLEESERMVKDMEKRSFTPQKDAAKREQDEANKFSDNIKNITKQCNENEQVSKHVEKLLSNYEIKLKELEDLMKQADEMVKKASNQNDLNSEGLKDILKRMNDLERERDLVRGQITLALDQLKETEDLLNMFSDSKTEYEQLAAELNGAKTELMKKIPAISQAAAKDNIVKEAEEHAKNLNKLAQELQEAVQNVSGRSGVQNALSVIEAYKNITDAVNAADEAAKKAKEAADKALSDVSQEDLINRAKSLKNNGNNLLKEAKNAAKDFKGATKDLNNQMERLKDAEKKQKALEEELLAVQDELKEIQRDDIGNIIDMAKKAAAAANRTTSDTMDQLNDIKTEVNKISVSPTVSNIDNVLSDVDKTVKTVSSSIPSLLDKIDELNSQISSGNNVSDNINKIKDLIEQAREAANRIVVPMKFTGNGHVELRPPRDIDDLRAYTTLTLSLQRPEKPPNRGDDIRKSEDNQFVLYLGNKDASSDYFGMALRENILHVIYKLNGEEYDIETTNITESPSEPAFFDKIDIHRIYQAAEVIHTQQFTSSNPKAPLTKGYLGQLTRNLLDLRPDIMVFYVGGYPDSFTPPTSLNYGKYKGCIEFTNFNEKLISLYNFKNAVNINLETPCKRHIPVKTPESDYFEGTGYAKALLLRDPATKIINQKMETRLEDALLMYLGDENDDFFYSISLERGYVVVRGQEKNNILEPLKSETKSSLSPEADVRIVISEKGFIVRVGSIEVKKTDIPQKFKHFYIGGIPKILRDRYNITTPALKGCVKIGTAAGVIPEIKEKVGIGRGCSQESLVVRKAEFILGSALEKLPEDFTLEGDVNLSLGFRSTEPDGLLLQNSNANNHIELSLENGHVVLKFQGNIWKSTKQYQDGEWHYVTVFRQGQRVELQIDEDDVGKKLTESSSGLDSPNILLGKDSFKGCISNLYLRRRESLYRAEDLSSYTSTGGVLLSTCRA